MAGVSAGTVDRILHNRGNVSAASREAVEKALQKKWKLYTLSLRADQTKLLGQIYTRCLVLQRTALPDGGLKLRLMSTEGNRQDLEKKLTAGLRP